jgi:hypothetical protein
MLPREGTDMARSRVLRRVLGTPSKRLVNLYSLFQVPSRFEVVLRLRVPH